jgi:hypothetical protein
MYKLILLQINGDIHYTKSQYTQRFELFECTDVVSVSLYRETGLAILTVCGEGVLVGDGAEDVEDTRAE